MLYFWVQVGSEVVTLQWHVGEKLDARKTPMHFRNVLEVQADSDELEFILENCENLPVASTLQKFNGQHVRQRTVTKKVQRWFGDHAKFIVANLLPSE